MTTTTLTMVDQVEDALAQLWLQLDHIGNGRYQEEIEKVLDTFPLPEGSVAVGRTIQQAHDLFRRVHNSYSPRTQRRTGHPLPGCPHCVTLGKEARN